MPLGSSEVFGLAYYTGDPSSAAIASFDVAKGTLVLDTTNGAAYIKTAALGTNTSGYLQLAKSTGATLISTITSKTYQKGVVTEYTGATDAIDISLGDIFILNRSGAVDAATLADPAAGDEGRIIWIKNGTTQANTITITSGLGGSGSSYDVLTFTNVVAANVSLRAYGTKWYMVGQHLTAVA